MAVLRFNNASLSFGEHNLFNNIDLSIEAGERVCIVGRNGTGKSTILKVIEGLQELDSGTLVIQDQVIKRLQQDPPEKLDISTYDYIAQGLEEASALLTDYHHLLNKLAEESSPELNAKLAQVQFEIDSKGYWSLDAQIQKIATNLNIPLDRNLSTFSGGWLRRIELARALVANPTILLLDEPTNHLDVESIIWLEEELLQFKGTLIFISHDRAFVNRVASRVIELDRGQVYSHPGNFDKYIELRNKRLADEETQVALFEKNLANEEVWIRKGIEARRTRNEGRVRALKQMRLEHAALRKLNSFGEIEVATSKSGKLVFDVKDLGLELSGHKIFSDFTTKVLAGNKIAIIGNNGAGKSSLIKVLIGELAPTKGTVHIGTNLEIAYFDQLRVNLDPELTAIENVFDGKVEAMVNGHLRHAIGYLADYLFTADKARSKVKTFSGGERNRLLLAKLLAKQSNLLVLDEPTNDLDLETLELLEDLVANYPGTVLLVSHDRAFIDNLVLESWFLDQGKVWQYIGGFTDNFNLHQQQLAKAQEAELKTKSKNKATNSPNLDEDASKKSASAKDNRPRLRKEKLSFKEKKELESLPLEIEELEAEISALEGKIARLSNDASKYVELDQSCKEMEAKLALLEAKNERWMELEIKKEEFEG